MSSFSTRINTRLKTFHVPSSSRNHFKPSKQYTEQRNIKEPSLDDLVASSSSSSLLFHLLNLQKRLAHIDQTQNQRQVKSPRLVPKTHKPKTKNPRSKTHWTLKFPQTRQRTETEKKLQTPQQKKPSKMGGKKQTQIGGEERERGIKKWNWKANGIYKYIVREGILIGVLRGFFLIHTRKFLPLFLLSVIFQIWLRWWLTLRQ